MGHYFGCISSHGPDKLWMEMWIQRNMFQLKKSFIPMPDDTFRVIYVIFTDDNDSWYFCSEQRNIFKKIISVKWSGPDTIQIPIMSKIYGIYRLKSGEERGGFPQIKRPCKVYSWQNKSYYQVKMLKQAVLAMHLDVIIQTFFSDKSGSTNVFQQQF